ncbi:MAG: cytochrome c [Reichenbachiella sp.]
MKSRFQFVALLISCYFLSCYSKNEENAKYRQYLYQGEQLYSVHCQNCHQKDGSGLGQIIPPLNNNIAKDNMGKTICAIKYGRNEDTPINGIQYLGKMPANTRLTTLEIAEISTYITNAWDEKNRRVTIKQVDSLLLNCGNY